MNHSRDTITGAATFRRGPSSRGDLLPGAAGFAPDPALVAAFEAYARVLHGTAQALGQTAWALRFAAGIRPGQVPTLADTERLCAAFDGLELREPVEFAGLDFSLRDRAAYWPRQGADAAEARDGLAWAVGRFLLGPEVDLGPGCLPSLPVPEELAQRGAELVWLAGFFRFGWTLTSDADLPADAVAAALAAPPLPGDFRGPWAETACAAAYRLWTARQEGGQAE